MKTLYVTLCIIGLAITINFSLSFYASSGKELDNEIMENDYVVSNKGDYRIVTDIKDEHSKAVGIPTYYQISFRTGDVLFEAAPTNVENMQKVSNKEYVFNGFINSNTILITKRDVFHNIVTPLYFHIESGTEISLPLDGENVNLRVLNLNLDSQEIYIEFTDREDA
ncbi:hypothetical protein [Guptibacillus spartinae]|uniref:hypothetical protein n=1 Tax=Guptibacillus spartinae TaxID=3025679 RepID=UPI00235DC7C4|nr:hypothetical protein [Pseudalkalibacillus spartinae]